MEKTEKKVAFKLPNKKVTVKPNFNNAGWIKDRRHRAFFSIEGTGRSYSAPLKKDGGLFNVLTDEEKGFLERQLHMENNHLSVYKPNGQNFWHNFFVKLTKDALILDLSDPMDYIKYKILIANGDHIAPSIKNIKDKATYKYYIEDKVDIDEIEQREVDLNTEAWAQYGIIAQDKRKVIDILKAYAVLAPKYEKYRNVAKDSSLKFLAGELGKLVGQSREQFIALINDPLLEARILISRSMDSGMIERRGLKYFIKGDGKAFANDLKAACEYVMADKNQEFKLTLEQKLDD
jgi:hypothetical protein